MGELSVTRDLDNDFDLGILLHLFLDYHWDAQPQRQHMESYQGDDWFQAYRNEIGLASAWLFHHVEWSRHVWEEMLACPASVYDGVHGFVKEEVFDFICRNSKWHAENEIGPSSAFTPSFIEDFTSEVAADFQQWLSDIQDNHSSRS